MPDVGPMEDRATLGISSQHLAYRPMVSNWGGPAFKAAQELVCEGLAQTKGRIHK